MNKLIGEIYLSLILILGIFYSSEPVTGKLMMIVMIFGIALVSIVTVWKLKDIKNIKIDKISLYFMLGILISYGLSSIIVRGFSFRELYAVFMIVIGLGLTAELLLKQNVEKILQNFLKAIIAISVISGIFGVYCYVKEISILSDIGGAYGSTGTALSVNLVTSIMRNPNSYALLCVISIAFSAILIAMMNSKKWNISLSINIVFQTYLTWITGSRTSLLIIIGFAGLYLIFFFKHKYKKYIVSSLIIVGVVLLILAITGIIPEGAAIISKFTGDDITSGRTLLWESALAGIKDNIFFGVGIKNSINVIAEYSNNLSEGLGTHNGYLGVLLANGAIVFTIIIGFILYSISNGIITLRNLSGKDRNVKSLLICFIIMMLVANITESLLFGDMNFPTIALWTILIINNNYKCSKRTF